MKKYTEIPTTTKKCVSIICDVCGKEYDIEEDFLEIQEFTHIKFTGGYASVFGDGDQYRCDICQHCLATKLGENLVHVRDTSSLGFWDENSDGCY
jgi:hypothetical protein